MAFASSPKPASAVISETSSSLTDGHTDNGCGARQVLLQVLQ